MIDFQIRDPDRAGARYLVQVMVVYGDEDDPNGECVPEFEIDVVK